jgi:hypothetical protein
MTVGAGLSFFGGHPVARMVSDLTAVAIECNEFLVVDRERDLIFPLLSIRNYAKGIELFKHLFMQQMMKSVIWKTTM